MEAERFLDRIIEETLPCTETEEGLPVLDSLTGRQNPGAIPAAETRERGIFESENGIVDALPDGLLKGFLMARDYIRENGGFDLNLAKDDYAKVLETGKTIGGALTNMPQKARILLRQSLEAAEFAATDDPVIIFGYDAKTDTFVYNPNNPDIVRYDLDTLLTHELAHRIDRWFVRSWSNPDFMDAIEAAKDVSDEVWEECVAYCKENDEDGYLSDILDAICESRFRFPARHGAGYWERPGNKAKDIFANLFSLEAFGDTKKLDLLRYEFPKLIEAYESLEYYIR